ncbi:formate dehydrogenase accessory sulfurtransferase FdhD [Phreatobacter stygius]|uniref:Sulfur carrier protein FdhD n=1 Tax=Phreatobacter stygius TaxID=1940610 RepID=A0A4D7B086_9HYPH|nr:formate dehydrogenase accessory sulfurtransferase FdhD [Phreatobacter stygius]QCI67039.1 formate dehydrogenase accessory sulfurtransferase FdhD [Phreatobacter stygius]
MSIPVSRSTIGRTLRYDRALDRPSAVEVPVEVPVNIVYGNLPYAVMMATPGDLDDFVAGFSLTEGIVRSLDDIRGVRVEEQADGFVVTVDLVAEALGRHLARRRSLSGRTSCGLCGVESLDQIPGASDTVAPAAPIAPVAIARALAGLDEHQPLHRLTRAVHAAAFCDPAGAILMAREDVGRHNALDKLIGACLRAGFNPADGFVVITSRCSFEMIEKAAIFGAGTLVAISAPTSLAIDRAHALGVSLVAVARRDAAVAFTHAPLPQREAIAS